MLVRKVLHTLYGAIFAIFIVVLVDLQLRTRTAQRYEGSLGDVFVRRPMIKDLNTSRERPPSVIGRRSEYSKAAEAINHILSDRKMLRRNTDKLILKRQPPTVAPLQLADIFIAVKTTSRFHVTRLALLLQTWISRTKGHTYIFTDNLDEDGVLKGFNVISTSCSPEHSHQALSCKMSVEYESFMASKKKWLCHVDDDNYVNPRALLTLLSTFPQDSDVYVGKPSLDRPMRIQELLENNETRQVEFWFATGGAGFCLSRRLAEKMAPWASSPRFEQTSAAIRLPDDCTVGFIVERRLGIPLVHSSMFHSHLENLQLLTTHDILLQVTLSYGLFENQMNSVELKGVFSQEDDPSRFKTVHCLLYPLTNWCP